VKAKRKKAGLNEQRDGEYRIVRKRVSSLKPSPENQMLYRPVDDDPDIDKLADAIAKNGCDPLTVTSDNFIVSGHRRHAALRLNGQSIVSCRVLPQRRDSMTTDEYLALLRSYNHQRHKNVAEQVREELIDIDPQEAHRKLRKQRDKSINAAEHNGVSTLTIEGAKIRHGIRAPNITGQ
jgi:ParB-like chromosome segregation protein Spo0J